MSEKPTEKKKVLIITYYWPPSGGAGVQRWLKFVKYLPLFNIDPIVLTVNSKHASYPVLDKSLETEAKGIEVHYTKTLEPFKIFQKISGAEKIPHGGNEVDVKNNLIKKFSHFIRGNFFIPDPRRGWNFFALKKAGELIRKHEIKTVITTSPPHSTQLIGLRLKKKYGIKWVSDLRDPWTKIYYYNTFHRTLLAKKLERKLEKSVLKSADKIIVVSEFLQKEYNELVDIDINLKTHIIPNGYDDEDFVNKKESFPETFTITYTGSIAKNYDLSGIYNALHILKKKEHNFILRFIGHINPEQTDIISQYGLSENTEIIGYVNHQKSIDYLMCSSLLLLIIPQTEGNKGILTGKLFEYLASKKPILCIGPVDGNAAKVIKETGSGHVFDYSNKEGVKEQLLSYYRSFTQKSLSFESKDINKYSRNYLTHKLARVINK